MSTRHWHGGELRRNAETNDWVVLAPQRRTRPHAGASAPCPFCPGPDEDTPPETWRLPGDGPGWRVRALPNRYALSDRHEIVIESPRHGWDFATAADHEVADVLQAWQQRHRALRGTAAQVVVFRNHGPAAGISLAHPHSQVAGLPVLSGQASRELAIARAHHQDRGVRLADDLLEAELTTGTRIVFADDQVVAFTPFAPAAAYELRIAPRRARADFAAAVPEEIGAVARCVRAVLHALSEELGDPAYNLIVRTAPCGFEEAPIWRGRCRSCRAWRSLLGWSWPPGSRSAPSRPSTPPPGCAPLSVRRCGEPGSDFGSAQDLFDGPARSG